MNENISGSVDENSPAVGSMQSFKAIVTGGLTVGVLDCLAATISSGLRGVTFTQVWQYVASGLLGQESYGYGWKSVALGLTVHFFIAFTVFTVYYSASRRLPLLLNRTFLCGSLYGAAVYFFMGYLVSPLSRAAKLPFSVRGLLTGLFIHIVCVGLPAAIVSRWFSRR